MRKYSKKLSHGFRSLVSLCSFSDAIKDFTCPSSAIYSLVETAKANGLNIYAYEASERFISDVKDKIHPQIEDWQNHPPDDLYPSLYIVAIYYSLRDNGVIRKRTIRI